MSRYPPGPSKPLTLLQINIGKGGLLYEIALSYAFSEKIDLLLVQEPYIYKDYPCCITKRYPSFKCFTPIDDWTSRQPRVLIYVCKGAGLQAT